MQHFSIWCFVIFCNCSLSICAMISNAHNCARWFAHSKQNKALHFSAMFRCSPFVTSIDALELHLVLWCVAKQILLMNRCSLLSNFIVTTCYWPFCCNLLWSFVFRTHDNIQFEASWFLAHAPCVVVLGDLMLTILISYSKQIMKLNFFERF